MPESKELYKVTGPDTNCQVAVMRAAGMTPTQTDSLIRFKKRAAILKLAEAAEINRLPFARWLVKHGRLSDY